MSTEPNKAQNALDNLTNTPDATGNFTQQDIESNKVMAALGYVLFVIPLLAAKDSPYAKFHANQGLLFLIVAIILNAAGWVLSLIPLLGWIANLVFGLVTLAIFALGVINALQGKAKQLPIIGGITLLK